MKKGVLTFVLTCFVAGHLTGQTITRNNTGTPEIQLPDIPGYLTLKCDFHMHTIFSDGVVWPTVRVQEALAEGLDAIAITDHVEMNRQYIEHNHAVAHEIAVRYAKNTGLLIIPGGEISASPDHFNALFLTDQNDVNLEDTIPAKRIAAANRQDAFVTWNHPGWTAKYKDGNMPWDEEFISLAEQKKFHGIEVCNGDGYWDGAFKFAREYGLTLMGTSDIHGVSYYPFTPDKHRTITLVFATEKSAEGVRAALLDRRTAIYQGDHLIGDERFLTPIFLESLDIQAEYGRGTTIAITHITNTSDVDYYCENKSPYSFYDATHFFTLKAHSTTRIRVKVNEHLPEISLDLVIHNLIVAPGESLELSLPVKVDLP